MRSATSTGRTDGFEPRKITLPSQAHKASRTCCARAREKKRQAPALGLCRRSQPCWVRALKRDGSSGQIVTAPELPSLEAGSIRSTGFFGAGV